MLIEEKPEKRLVSIWLTHAESENKEIMESLQPIYMEYKVKKYLVAVYESGTEDLEKSIRDLLIYNRTRLRELEMEEEKKVGRT